MARNCDCNNGGTNFLLGLILLSMAGVPVLAIFSQLLFDGVLFGGLLIGAIWKWVAIGLLVWGAWHFLHWYVPQVRQEYRIAKARASVWDGAAMLCKTIVIWYGIAVGLVCVLYFV